MPVEFREATDAELAAIYRRNSEHEVCAVDGVPVAHIGLCAVAGRFWGVFAVLVEVDAHVNRRVFYQFRRRLRERTTTIHVMANDAGAERLLWLLGLRLTDEVYAGKRVWIWMPDKR